MANSINISTIYDTLLSSPGMNEAVKIDLKIPRKTVLALTRILEIGLESKNPEGVNAALFEFLQKESFPALQEIISDCLQKAGLTELNEKLKNLNQM